MNNVISNEQLTADLENPLSELKESKHPFRKRYLIIVVVAISIVVLSILGILVWKSLDNTATSTNIVMNFDLDTSDMKELRNDKYDFALLYGKGLLYFESGANSSQTFLFSASLVPPTTELKGQSIDISIYHKGSIDLYDWIDSCTVNSYNEDTSQFTDAVYFVNETDKVVKFQFKGHPTAMFSDLLLTVPSIRFMVEDGDNVIGIMYSFSDRSGNLEKEFLDTVASLELSKDSRLGIDSEELNKLSTSLEQLL